ncbi:MAG: hypothetical protein ACRC1K_08200, partial [Planctomycetia bacterium]
MSTLTKPMSWRSAALAAVLLFSEAQAAEPVAVEVTPADGPAFKLTDAKFSGNWVVEGSRDGKPYRSVGDQITAVRFQRDPAPLAVAGPQVVLTTGETIPGDVVSSTADDLVVRNPRFGEATVPLTAVAGIVVDREARPAEVAGLVKQIRERPRQSDLLILRNK